MTFRTPLASVLLSLSIAGAPASAREVVASAEGAIAPDGVDRLMLGTGLGTRPVRVTGLDDRGVRWTNAAGEDRATPWEDVLALLPTDNAIGLSDEARLRQRRATRLPLFITTDGQRFTARPTPDANDPDRVELRLSSGDLVHLLLDRIASVHHHETLDPDPDRDAPELDTLELLNGDVLRGFVEEIGAEIVFDADGSVVRAPLSAVGALRLANPPSARAAGGVMLRLDDGAVYASQNLSTPGPGLVRFELSIGADAERETHSESAPAITVPLSRIVGVVDRPDSGARGVAALSATSATYTPGDGRRWSPPMLVTGRGRAVLGDGVIELPGPGTAQWILPRGASRFAGLLTLGDRPGVWADCEAVLLQGDRELLRARLTPETPDAEINVPLIAPGRSADAQPLRLIILEGPSGPVHDRVRLERALILTDG